MEDCLMDVLVLCLNFNYLIAMFAYGLTIITLEVIPDNWYFKKCSRIQFERFVFFCYFLIIWGITLIWL